VAINLKNIACINSIDGDLPIDSNSWIKNNLVFILIGIGIVSTIVIIIIIFIFKRKNTTEDYFNQNQLNMVEFDDDMDEELNIGDVDSLLDLSDDK